MARFVNKDAYNVGIIGATGVVGETFLEILEERDFPIAELRLFSSERSAGTLLTLADHQVHTETVSEERLKDLDFCFLTAGGDSSREYIPWCREYGCIAIDNTSAFRLDKNVPLVVPEVNPGDLGNIERGAVIANPNCSTIQLVMALGPIHADFGLKRVIVSTYQSTSGAGRRAMGELSEQVTSMFNSNDVVQEVFPHQIAFNCIPQIGAFEENGFTQEEMKMVNETRKILRLPKLAISATTVRVPTFCAHSESIYIETEDEIDVQGVKEVLSGAPGIAVLDDTKKGIYPLPFDAVGCDEVFVGRIRQDLDQPNGIHLWVVSDNLRKGAALNAVQIAETLIQSLH